MKVKALRNFMFGGHMYRTDEIAEIDDFHGGFLAHDGFVVCLEEPKPEVKEEVAPETKKETKKRKKKDA